MYDPKDYLPMAEEERIDREEYYRLCEIEEEEEREEIIAREGSAA